MKDNIVREVQMCHSALKPRTPAEASRRLEQQPRDTRWCGRRRKRSRRGRRRRKDISPREAAEQLRLSAINGNNTLAVLRMHKCMSVFVWKLM